MHRLTKTNQTKLQRNLEVGERKLPTLTFAPAVNFLVMSPEEDSFKKRTTNSSCLNVGCFAMHVMYLEGPNPRKKTLTASNMMEYRHVSTNGIGSRLPAEKETQKKGEIGRKGWRGRAVEEQHHPMFSRAHLEFQAEQKLWLRVPVQVLPTLLDETWRRCFHRSHRQHPAFRRQRRNYSVGVFLPQ